MHRRRFRRWRPHDIDMERVGDVDVAAREAIAVPGLTETTVLSSLEMTILSKSLSRYSILCARMPLQFTRY